LARKAKVLEFKESQTFEQMLMGENKRLKAQLVQVMKENAIMRKQLKQPETGPILPTWINKDSVRLVDNEYKQEYIYEALNESGQPIMLRRDGKWVLLSHVIYVQHHGTIPAGHSIYHIDGDAFNNKPENLIALTKQDYCKNIYAE